MRELQKPHNDGRGDRTGDDGIFTPVGGGFFAKCPHDRLHPSLPLEPARMSAVVVREGRYEPRLNDF